MAEKLYYSMGEVAEMFDVNLSLIRYWDSKFDVLKPKKNKKGNRMFRPEDIETFKVIYHLVKECGMTLEGAQRAMRSRGKGSVTRSAELMERLQRVRSELEHMREMLGGESAADEVVVDDETPAEPVPAGSGVRVIEPGPSQQRSEEERTTAVRNPKPAELPFYEQTLF